MLDGNFLSTAVMFLMFRAGRTQNPFQCLLHMTLLHSTCGFLSVYGLYTLEHACLRLEKKKNLNIFYYVTGELLLYLDSFSSTYF